MADCIQPDSPLPDAEIGEAYSQDLTAPGKTVIGWQIIAGELPPGLTFNENTGQISGTPTGPFTGIFNFTVEVEFEAGCPVLTDAERAAIEYVVDYLRKASTDRPMDEISAGVLARHAVSFGFGSEIKLREALRDAPLLTLFQIFRYLDDRACP